MGMEISGYFPGDWTGLLYSTGFPLSSMVYFGRLCVEAYQHTLVNVIGLDTSFASS